MRTTGSRGADLVDLKPNLTEPIVLDLFIRTPRKVFAKNRKVPAREDGHEGTGNGETGRFADLRADFPHRKRVCKLASSNVILRIPMPIRHAIIPIGVFHSIVKCVSE